MSNRNLDDKLTIIISSCDAFSDLWDGQIRQLKKYWPDHPSIVFIITDKPTQKQYENIEIIVAPQGYEWSERLNYALGLVKTKYVFFTLDDYFLINKVKVDKITDYLSLMDKRDVDYIRIFKRRKKFTEGRVENYTELRWLPENSDYAINFYPGIWKTNFLKFASRERRTAWQQEVSLKKAGLEYGAKCMVCMDDTVYEFLDVVRKGKLLRKANSYFKTHDIYHGNRGVNSWFYETKLKVLDIGGLYAPRWMFKLAKRIMNSLGHHYFSDEDF